MTASELFAKQDKYITENWKLMTDQEMYEDMIQKELHPASEAAIKMRRLRLGFRKYNKKIKVNT